MHLKVTKYIWYLQFKKIGGKEHIATNIQLCTEKNYGISLLQDKTFYFNFFN